jgi:hypothetical protein
LPGGTVYSGDTGVDGTAAAAIRWRMPRPASRQPSLMQALRRRAGSHWRGAILLLFVLGVAAQSTLGPLGELHELTVHAQAGQGLAEHMAPHDHEAALRDGTDATEGGPLHMLFHYTHCCGHSTWMADATAMIAVAAMARSDSPVGKTRQLPAPDRTVPFRPPIAV